jgi:hypothetical protein
MNDNAWRFRATATPARFIGFFMNRLLENTSFRLLSPIIDFDEENGIRQFFSSLLEKPEQPG